ncbi:MAG: hypothetical protein KDD61_15275 [Bdellovibrionales bacterium]|nr:hypothetical protein [Bdellovibrionales bacterium]
MALRIGLKITLLLPLVLLGFSVMGKPLDNHSFLWIVDSKKLHLALKDGDPWPQPKDIKLTTSDNKPLPIASMNYNISGIDIFLQSELPKDRNIKIQWWNHSHFAYPTLPYLNQNFFYQGDDLGATVQSNQIQFKVWSPTAESIFLVLYQPDETTVQQKIPMHRNHLGVWHTTIPIADNVGRLYQYEVKAFGKTELALDPYAKSMGGQTLKDRTQVGKAAIVKLPFTPPHSPMDNMANEVDVLLYEAHIRDFSIHPDSPTPLIEKGTYSGFSYALPHISDLGVTHIQFQPLQNFHSVNEYLKDYQGDNIPMPSVNYNWGYDSQSFFTPEGWFSSDPKNPMARVLELRQLIRNVHKRGLGATLDVVYNHIYNEKVFETVAPGTYLRRNRLGNVSFGTGAGATLESRMVMMRKLIIDSLKFWKDFYGFDGFRFDLMGFLDHDTMRAIRKELGPRVLLYGEAWNFTDLPWQQATTKSNLPCEALLGVFNDTTRDAILGREGGKGFVQGVRSQNSQLRSGIIGALIGHPQDGLIHRDGYHRFAKEPFQSLNYFSIHDGFTAWDKINFSLNASVLERQRRLKMAFAMLMTAQGRVIFQGGSEFGRSKPLAPNDPTSHRAHTSVEVNPDHGVYYLHENSYQSPDITNALRWPELSKHKEVFDYVKGLIQLRRHVPAFRFSKAQSIRQGVTFIGQDALLGPQPLPDSAGYSDFLNPKLNQLQIEFFNAPFSMHGHKYYITGEVHSGTNKNPLKNPFWIAVNRSGKGVVTLSRKQLEQLDLAAWTEKGSLQIKLVKTPGQWDSPSLSYSPFGHNTVTPQSILVGNRVKIDLSVKDHQAGFQPADERSVVAFRLNNSLESDHLPQFPLLPYSEFIVIHNNAQRELFLPVSNLGNPSHWDVLVDSQRAGIEPLSQSETVIFADGVVFSRNSTTVIGRRK